jgi:hypothetical protein
LQDRQRLVEQTNTQELLTQATFTPVTSVTERTTDLLVTEKRVPSAELNL